MTRTMFIAGLLALGAASALAPVSAEARRRPLPSYAKALRCTGLTVAWRREVPEASAEGLRRFDASLFWGLAASETARRSGVPAARMEAEIEAAVSRAQAEFGSSDARASARRELAACIAEVPRMQRRRGKG